MRLLLASFFMVLLYQCASPQRDKVKDITLNNGIEINRYNGKVINYIKAGDYNDLFIYFKDGDSMHIHSWKYPMHWLIQQ